MSYSIESTTSNCYEGTTCLINKFNIRDEQKLASLEAMITLAKASELGRKNPTDRLDFYLYRSIHKYLFDDIYDWAGEIRNVNISKKGTNFIEFKDIEKQAELIFSRLESMNYFKDLSFDSYINELVDFYCITNLLHPFREGNGRTQRIFISYLVNYSGYSIDFSNIDSDELMIATIQSANGVKDNLIRIFEENIHKEQL